MAAQVSPLRPGATNTPVPSAVISAT
jgi:hypothetical protein